MLRCCVEQGREQRVRHIPGALLKHGVFTLWGCFWPWFCQGTSSCSLLYGAATARRSSFRQVLIITYSSLCCLAEDLEVEMQVSWCGDCAQLISGCKKMCLPIKLSSRKSCNNCDRTDNQKANRH